MFVVRSLQLLLTAIWLVASVYLAIWAEDGSTGLRIAAASIVGAPGAIAFAWSLGQLLGKPPVRTKKRVKRILKSALIELHREGIYEGDISRVSFHVWVIPQLWRLIVPLRIRRRPVIKNRVPTWLRSPLLRFSEYRFEYRPNSRIAFFRKGVGLVGRCVDLNDKDKIHIVRFDSAEFQEALASDESWHESPVSIHQNLSREQGQELAKRYSQAAAIVLQGPKGEALGCLTLDLPPNCILKFKSSVQGDSDSDPLRQILRKIAELVEGHLTFIP